MKLSRRALALAVALVTNVVLAVLLSPLGFESRPPSDLKIAGYGAIAAVFAGIIVDVVAIVLLFRRTRWASILAIIGSIVFLIPAAVDQTGSFFSLPIPVVINTLEYVFVGVLLVTFVLAAMVYKESTPSAG